MTDANNEDIVSESPPPYEKNNEDIFSESPPLYEKIESVSAKREGSLRRKASLIYKTGKRVVCGSHTPWYDCITEREPKDINLLTQTDNVKGYISRAIKTYVSIVYPKNNKSAAAINTAQKLGEAIAAVAMVSAEITDETPIATSNFLTVVIISTCDLITDAQNDDLPPFTLRCCVAADMKSLRIIGALRFGPHIRGFYNSEALQNALEAVRDLMYAEPKSALDDYTAIFRLIFGNIGRAVAVQPPGDRRYIASMYSNYAKKVGQSFQ